MTKLAEVIVILLSVWSIATIRTRRQGQDRVNNILAQAMARQGPVTIVAFKSDPAPWEFGLVYFDEQDWPVPGYEFVKRVVDATASQLRKMERER